jgi:hypothetical protein
MRTLFGIPWNGYQTPGGTYTADGAGRLENVADSDIITLRAAGCTLTIGNTEFQPSSVGSGLTATGTTIDDALILPAQYNIINYSGPGSGAVLPASIEIGSGIIVVLNRSANPINMYSSGDTLDGLPAGIPSLLADGHLGLYFATGEDQAAYVSAVIPDMRAAGSGGGLNLLGKLIGADMNSVNDQPVQMLMTADFRVRQVTVVKASVLLDAAVGGVYTDENKGGSALVGGSQTYDVLIAPNMALDLPIVGTPGNTIWPGGTQLYLSLSMPQGIIGATADFYFYGSN